MREKLGFCFAVVFGMLVVCGAAASGGTDACGSQTLAAPTAAPGPSAPSSSANAVAVMHTSLGDITISLFTADAPITAGNFISLSDSHFYDGLVFHRVIKNFVVQAGGLDSSANEKTSSAIAWEDTGHQNLKYTIAMARTGDPDLAADKDTGTCQFFINTANNNFLDGYVYPYVVFGEVTAGKTVVDAINLLPTATHYGYEDWPDNPPVISGVDISYHPPGQAPVRINSDSDPAWSQFPGRNITGLVIDGAGLGSCIYIGNCTQAFTVSDCVLYNATGRMEPYFLNTALGIFSCSNALVVNNTCTGSGFAGIGLIGSGGNTIAGNTCTANAQFGIGLNQSGGNALRGNNCTQNGVGGLGIDASDGNTVTGCHFYGNVEFGAGLKSYSSLNTLTGNTAMGNQFGFVLDASARNTIAYNYIKDNTGYGANAQNSQALYNRISHNMFVANNGGGKQAMDMGATFWNDSAKGNYWADWTGPDNDSDGIVDFAYRMAGMGGAKDNYPLADPVAIAEAPPAATAVSVVLLVSLVFLARRKDAA